MCIINTHTNSCIYKSMYILFHIHQPICMLLNIYPCMIPDEITGVVMAIVLDSTFLPKIYPASVWNPDTYKSYD